MENTRLKLHLSNTTKVQYCEQEISKLKQEVGALKAYIEELESADGAVNLYKKKLIAAEKERDHINTLYSIAVADKLNDHLLKKYKEDIIKLQKENDSLKKLTEDYIIEIVRLKHG